MIGPNAGSRHGNPLSVDAGQAWPPSAMPAYPIALWNPSSMKIHVTAQPHHLELIVITGTITAPKLIRVVDVLANALAHNASHNVLVEVRAQSRDIPLLEAFAILAHAIKRQIMQTKIAYVITGRSALSITWFFEEMAGRRVLKMRFFSNRTEALDWLGVAQKSIAA